MKKNLSTKKSVEGISFHRFIVSFILSLL